MQAAVDVDGSQLVLSSRVSVCASDRNELVADVEAIPVALGAADRVLADSGYATGSEVSQLEGRGVEVLVATGAEGHAQPRSASENTAFGDISLLLTRIAACR